MSDLPTEPDAPPPRAGISDAQARLTGLLYLGTILCGLFAELGVRAHIRADDAAATMLNIAQQQSLYRAGEVADLLMLSCYIAVTALLYRLFAATRPLTALVAAGFSLVGIAILAVAGLLHLVPLYLLNPAPLARADSIALFALELHGGLYGISLFFFGVYCTMIGWLCLTSRLLPQPVGALMMAGGVTHIVTKLLWILAPAAAQLVPRPLNMLPLLGEAALALWLLFFGLRHRVTTR